MNDDGKGKEQKSDSQSSVRQVRDVGETMLYNRISEQLPAWRERVSRLMKDHGTFKVCNVTVEQIYGGIRGVQIQVSDISYVDPNEGIRLRGMTIPEVLECLPKAPGSEFPLLGGLYFLLLVGRPPSLEEALTVEDDWKCRSEVPGYVLDVINSMPHSTHPMTMFSMAILAMQNESDFLKLYDAGMMKTDYWEPYLEDSLNLVAKLPSIAAYIYNLKYRSREYIRPNLDLDWGANFAYMIGKGIDKEYQDLCRLYLLLHSDHEGANVSAHATHLVATALADVYYACSAGMDGLAGPLHGVANQECLHWLLNLRKEFGGIPTPKQFEEYAWKELKGGKVIPGYGHAVLRITDPRFTALYNFSEKHFPNYELFNLVKLVYDVLPGVLTQFGKIKNPWPNVDAINGTTQYYYGIKGFDFYTVLFGVSRILGLTAHVVWARALGKPIERPKSLTTYMLEQMVVQDNN
jgi:citrate synthase